MNESEWRDATGPATMLAFRRDSARLTDRKARLFAAAVCRHIWRLLTDRRSQAAVEVAEANRRADSKTSADARAAARVAASRSARLAAWAAADACLVPRRARVVLDSAVKVARLAEAAVGWEAYERAGGPLGVMDSARAVEQEGQVGLLHDLVGPCRSARRPQPPSGRTMA